MTTFNDTIKSLVISHLEGSQESGTCQVIHTRGKNRGGLLRISPANGNTVIVKLWQIRNFKEKLKTILRFSNGRQEWQKHSYAYKRGIKVPLPIGYKTLTLSNNEKWEAMVIEDLGVTEQGLSYLKMLISKGQESEVFEFEKNLINLTADIINQKIVDIDHQLNNFLIKSDSSLFRIDFECAKTFRLKALISQKYIEMLSRLLASHVYAVQPDVERTKRFAEQLYKELIIDRKMRAMINKSVNEKLEYQFQKVGISSFVTLPD